MDDKMRARNYYAAAVLLFQEPSASDCERAIELLNKAFALYPCFSEVSIFREEVWHYLLKSLDGTYENYLESPAWEMKRDAVKQRDGGQCVCGAKATEVHHKTYNNIGKEPLSDLVFLCEECHERVHEPYVPSDPQSSTKPASGVLSNDPREIYWDKFKTYVKENGSQLQLFPKPDLPMIYGIQIDQKTLNSDDRFKDGAFWLIAYRGLYELQANLRMESSIHYNQLKEQKDIIEGHFENNLGELIWKDKGNRIGFSDNTVGNVRTADTDREFLWLHDRLIRLHEVFQPLVLELQR